MAQGCKHTVLKLLLQYFIYYYFGLREKALWILKTQQPGKLPEYIVAPFGITIPNRENIVLRSRILRGFCCPKSRDIED